MWNKCTCNGKIWINSYGCFGKSNQFPKLFVILAIITSVLTVFATFNNYISTLWIKCETVVFHNTKLTANAESYFSLNYSNIRHHQQFQAVSNDSRLFVYSAYLEEDTKSGLSELRLIGIATTSKRYMNCLIWHNSSTTHPTRVHASIDLINRRQKHMYTSVFAVCYLCGNSRPIAVIITDADKTSEQPHHILPVVNPQHGCASCPHGGFFLTTCVTPLHGNYSKTWRLVEWIELNRILGIDYFVVYISSVNTKTLNVLQFYETKGILEIVKWPITDVIKGDNIHYYGQQAALNDCLYKMKQSTDYLTTIDVDEFIFPQKSGDITLHDMMFRLPDTSVWMFRHIAFNLNKYPTDLDTKLSDLVTQNNIFRDDIIKPKGDRSKVIMRPRDVAIMGVHDTWRLKRGKKHVVDVDIGLLHHYRAQSVDGIERFVKHNVALKYSRELKVNLNKSVMEMKEKNNISF